MPWSDGKSGNADAAKAEVIGAIVVAIFGMRIWLDGEFELLGDFFDFGIKRGAFRAADFHFFRDADVDSAPS